MSTYNVPKGLDAFVKQMGDGISWRASRFAEDKYAISIMGLEFDIVCDEFIDGYSLQYGDYQPDQTILDTLHTCIVSNKN